MRNQGSGLFGLRMVFRLIFDKGRCVLSRVYCVSLGAWKGSGLRCLGLIPRFWIFSFRVLGSEFWDFALVLRGFGIRTYPGFGFECYVSRSGKVWGFNVEVRVWGFRNGGAGLWMSLAGSVVESFASKTLTSTEKTPNRSWSRSHLCRRSQLEVSRLVPETLDLASLNNLGYGRGIQGCYSRQEPAQP